MAAFSRDDRLRSSCGCRVRRSAVHWVAIAAATKGHRPVSCLAVKFIIEFGYIGVELTFVCIQRAYVRVRMWLSGRRRSFQFFNIHDRVESAFAGAGQVRHPENCE